MRRWWRVIIWVALVLAALWFLWVVRAVLPPFVAAWVIASFMEPTIKRLRGAGHSRLRSVFLVYLLFFLVLGFLGLVSGPPLVAQVSQTVDKAPDYVKELQDKVVGLIPTDRDLKRYEPMLTAVGLKPTQKDIFDKEIQPRLTDVQSALIATGKSLLGKLSAVATWVMMLVMTPILTFIVMLDYDAMRRRLLRLIPMSIRGPSVQLLEDVGDVFTNYARGLMLSVLIYSVLASFVFAFLGLPAPIVLGVMAGFFSCAPYVGPFITTSVIVIVTLAAPVNGYSPYWTWGGSGAHIIGSAVTYFAYDQLYGTFILPRIAGKAVGVHIFVGFFAIAAGGALFGLPGIIVAYPIAGSVRVILERILNVVVEDRPTRKVQIPRIPLRFRATT